ncbi:MAG: dCTP deaminase [Clostridiales bacterium]|jgi:dCTP deaminase|nr:dCTP deaminase [Clostridiales bacterium]
MILHREVIESEVKTGRIEINPFKRYRLLENSYVVTLGEELLIYTGDIVDTAKENTTRKIIIGHCGFVLEKGKFYVGHIAEYIGSDFYVPLLHGILSVAQLGLFIHVTANLIDIGNHCNFSLHLFATENIAVHPSMEIAQVSFWLPIGEKKLYSGKYKNVKGAAASQSYKHAGT